MQQLMGCKETLRGGDKPLSTEEEQFSRRIDNLMNLMEVFDRVTTAFLPFINTKHAPIIRQLIQMAESLHEDDADHSTQRDS